MASSNGSRSSSSSTKEVLASSRSALLLRPRTHGGRSGLGALHLTTEQFLGFALVLGGLQRVGVLTRQHAVILRLDLSLSSRS